MYNNEKLCHCYWEIHSQNLKVLIGKGCTRSSHTSFGDSFCNSNFMSVKIIALKIPLHLISFKINFVYCFLKDVTEKRQRVRLDRQVHLWKEEEFDWAVKILLGCQHQHWRINFSNQFNDKGWSFLLPTKCQL